MSHPDPALQDTDLAVLANTLRLLGHPMRLSIALLLLSGPRTVAAIESLLDLRQPNLSQHLAILRDAHVLVSSRKAKSVTYEIAEGLPGQILAALAAIRPGRPPARETAAPAALPAHGEIHSPDSGAGAAPAPIHGSDQGEALVFATIRPPGKPAA